MVMRVMRISDTECGAICLLNVTAELHQSFVPVKQKTCEANIHADMWRHLTVAVFNHNLQQGSRDTWRWATLASNWRAIRLKGNLARHMYLNQFAHQLYPLCLCEALKRFYLQFGRIIFLSTYTSIYQAEKFTFLLFRRELSKKVNK